MPNRVTLLLYYLMLASQLIFGIISWVLIFFYPDTILMRTEQSDLLIPTLVLIMAVGAAFFIDLSRGKQARRLHFDEGTKPKRYRTTVLLRSAIVQSGNLLVLTIAVLSKRMDLLALVLPGLLLYGYFRPSTRQYVERYG